MNKEINVLELIEKSKPVEVCYQPPMVSNGCAVHADYGWHVPPAMGCATWYCNGVQMPIPTYICGAQYFPDRAQGFIDLASKDSLLNGTCVKLTPPEPPQGRIIKE
jgi:hypothetical protein